METIEVVPALADAPVVSGRPVADWLAAPANAVLALILFAAALRLVFAAMMGLGVDETYMVAAGRHPQLSYFDHPPLSWWLAWGAARLFGGEAAIVVRLPFIALFGLSTWLMYRLGEVLFSARAGLWAAVTLNFAPVFGVTTASWVLPDGPLDCALLGMMLCLVHALATERWRWWIGVGVCGGLALLSKYTAILTIAGGGLYLLTQPLARRWLVRPQPYLAAAIGLAMVSPVLVWNAQHQWVSFLFQGGRAQGLSLHPLAPLVTLAGEALFVLPWMWLSLMIALARSVRRGPSDAGGWLLCCAGAIPIVAFCLVALWSSHAGLYHWAAPGYLMLFPMFGAAIAERLGRGDRSQRRWLAGTAIAVVGVVAVLASDVCWNWWPQVGGDRLTAGKDPALEAVGWSSLQTQLVQRGLSGPGVAAIAATRWQDAGKLDYALGGETPVICLGDDPRQYGVLQNRTAYLGHDILIIAPGMTQAKMDAKFGPAFERIESLPPLVLLHAGRPAMVMPVFLGHAMRSPLTTF